MALSAKARLKPVGERPNCWVYTNEALAMKTKKLDMEKPPISVSPMNSGSRKSRPNPRAITPSRAGCRFSGANVSGSMKAVSARASSPATARTTKISRQLPIAISPLPASGASIGEIEMTSITIAISRVASGPVCRSRMIARGTTITVAAPSPCTSRAKMSMPIEGASAQPSVPKRKIERPT